MITKYVLKLVPKNQRNGRAQNHVYYICHGSLLIPHESRPSCDANYPAVGSYCLNYAHSWTDKACAIRAKIDIEGNVAILHAPFGAYTEEINDSVREDSKTFFRVDWSGDVNVFIESCNATGACNTTSDGMCVCDIVVSDEQAYFDGATPDREEILNALRIGATLRLWFHQRLRF